MQGEGRERCKFNDSEPDTLPKVKGQMFQWITHNMFGDKNFSYMSYKATLIYWRFLHHLTFQ